MPHVFPEKYLSMLPNISDMPVANSSFNPKGTDIVVLKCCLMRDAMRCIHMIHCLSVTEWYVGNALCLKGHCPVVSHCTMSLVAQPGTRLFRCIGTVLPHRDE